MTDCKVKYLKSSGATKSCRDLAKCTNYRCRSTTAKNLLQSRTGNRIKLAWMDDYDLEKNWVVEHNPIELSLASLSFLSNAKRWSSLHFLFLSCESYPPDTGPVPVESSNSTWNILNNLKIGILWCTYVRVRWINRSEDPELFLLVQKFIQWKQTNFEHRNELLRPLWCPQ